MPAHSLSGSVRRLFHIPDHLCAHTANTVVSATFWDAVATVYPGLHRSCARPTVTLFPHCCWHGCYCRATGNRTICFAIPIYLFSATILTLRLPLLTAHYHSVRAAAATCNATTLPANDRAAPAQLPSRHCGSLRLRWRGLTAWLLRCCTSTRGLATARCD